MVVHSVGIERDKAGHRKLFYDHYAALLLRYFFNPILTSLRSIQHASELKKVQRVLGCSRAALGSLSEAAQVFDADVLQGVIAELVEQVKPLAVPKDLDAGSSFICRIQDNSVWQLIEERPVGHEGKAAGVVRDILVKIGGPQSGKPLKTPIRIVEVHTGKIDKYGNPERLLLATDRGDLEAELIAVGYRHRWSVELFFRWFKCILGCRHLLSQRENGLEIQVYMAIIASVLIRVWTGRKPTQRTFEMICFYFSGWADEEELQAHMERLQKHDS